MCAFLERLEYIGIGLIIGFVSDLLDGAIARKLDQISEFGGKFVSPSYESAFRPPIWIPTYNRTPLAPLPNPAHQNHGCASFLSST